MLRKCGSQQATDMAAGAEAESWEQRGNTGSSERPLLPKPAAGDFLQQGAAYASSTSPDWGPHVQMRKNRRIFLI